jgi:hypothetical protein
VQGKDNETRVCWDDCSDNHVKTQDPDKERKERIRTVGLSVGIGIAALASIVIATLMYRRYRMKVSEPEPEPESAPSIEELRRQFDNLRSSTISNGTAAS